MKRVLIGAGGMLILSGVAGWMATGREGFTRWPNRKLELTDCAPAPAEADLLADMGFDAPDASEPPEIESRFALGLAPSGADPKHLLSVASLIGLGAIVAGAGFVAGRRSTRTTDTGATS